MQDRTGQKQSEEIGVVQDDYQWQWKAGYVENAQDVGDVGDPNEVIAEAAARPEDADAKAPQAAAQSGIDGQ